MLRCGDRPTQRKHLLALWLTPRNNWSAACSMCRLFFLYPFWPCVGVHIQSVTYGFSFHKFPSALGPQFSGADAYPFAGSPFLALEWSSRLAEMGWRQLPGSPIAKSKKSLPQTLSPTKRPDIAPSRGEGGGHDPSSSGLIWIPHLERERTISKNLPAVGTLNVRLWILVVLAPPPRSWES